MFSKAPQSVIDQLGVAFGFPPRCIGQRYVEFLAELEAQAIIGKDMDMTYALSVMRSIYPSGANILAAYMGESAAPALAPPPPASSPFASVLAQQKVLTVNSLMSDPDLEHFRTSILIQMDKTEGWFQFLKNRKLLGSMEMEAWIANIRRQWEHSHRGAPTLTVFTELSSRDSKFSQTDLSTFAHELIDLNIPPVTAEVVTLTSWIDAQKEKNTKASEVAFSAQSDLRSWLLKNNICDATEVDALITHLRKAGVKNADNIRGFDKSELKECGFNTVQAIAILKALK